MSNKERKVALRIELTPEQREQVRQATGQSVASLQLRAMMAEALEERVAPSFMVDFSAVEDTREFALVGEPSYATPINIPFRG